MSNRVIKDSIWHSNKLAACSWKAQLHYPRLYLLIDDWSCFEIDVPVIRGKVYPKLPEVTLKDIEDILKEFEANGLLFVWTANGKKYGYFTGDEAGRLEPPSRRHKRHTPEPPQKELAAYCSKFNGLEAEPTKAFKEGSKDYDLDTRGYKVHTKKRPNLNLNPNPNPNLSIKSEKTDFGPLFEELWKQWPPEGRFKKKYCRMKFLALCKQGKLEEFRKTARGYSDYLKHKKENENFAQQPMHLSTFLNNWEEEKERYVNFKYQARL